MKITGDEESGITMNLSFEEFQSLFDRVCYSSKSDKDRIYLRRAMHQANQQRLNEFHEEEWGHKL